MKVAVASRSFSANLTLRAALKERGFRPIFNDTGRTFDSDELVDFIGDSDAAIIGLETINSNIISRCFRLRVISKYGVGLDSIDLNALQTAGVRLGWTSGVNRRSVSELTLLLILAGMRMIQVVSNEVKSGTWRQLVGSELTKKRVGIVGLGNIGKDLVSLLRPFDVDLLAFDIKHDETFNLDNGIKPRDLLSLFKEADVVTIHLPLTASTKNMITNKYIDDMKASAMLINCARGGIVDEDAILSALANQRIRYAGFDVLSNEPPRKTDLLAHSNFLCTPHIGGSTSESILRMGFAAIDGLTSARDVNDVLRDSAFATLSESIHASSGSQIDLI